MLYLWILRVVFLVGTTEEPELQERIDRESSTYMDIVQVSTNCNPTEDCLQVWINQEI